eukprot:1952286-Amphidinium_carterae.1
MQNAAFAKIRLDPCLVVTNLVWCGAGGRRGWRWKRQQHWAKRCFAKLVKALKDPQQGLLLVSYGSLNDYTSKVSPDVIMSPRASSNSMRDQMCRHESLSSICTSLRAWRYIAQCIWFPMPNQYIPHGSSRFVAKLARASVLSSPQRVLGLAAQDKFRLHHENDDLNGHFSSNWKHNHQNDSQHILEALALLV